MIKTRDQEIMLEKILFSEKELSDVNFERDKKMHCRTKKIT